MKALWWQWPQIPSRDQMDPLCRRVRGALPAAEGLRMARLRPLARKQYGERVRDCGHGSGGENNLEMVFKMSLGP